MDNQFSKFLEVFKWIHINIPFAEDLEKMSSYVKFMIDILSKKIKMDDFDTVAFTEECSAILQIKPPPKLRDPGSFTIPCTFGRIEGINNLCDLGASINLMPLKPNEDPLNLTLVREDFVDQDGKDAREFALGLDSYGPLNLKCFEELGVIPINLMPSIEKPLELELKVLLDHMRYEFLGVNKTLPVIVFASLSMVERKKLLRVLTKHMRAIGWTLADIKGISPSTVMHRILMEEGVKLTIEAQRRLNPLMKELVRKEVVKWLDAGVAYPISDSKWVSPIHVVPKIGGMTVVKNKKNELIPTRTITGWKIYIDYGKLNKARGVRGVGGALNYANTEKAMLAIVFACYKFRPYLIGNKVIVYTDHSAIKYLMTKKDAKPRLI
uniref:Reverse transcriptase RNase H-like domain-containing protein n=1 Tax=Cannabis sativa TaxID=3483 RepID=A0A803PIL6_CANSA